MATKNTFSTGHERSRLHTYWQYATHLARNQSIPERIYRQAFRNALAVAQAHDTTDIRSRQVLEVGCGQRFAATLLFHSLGVKIVGIDADFVDPRFGLRSLVKVWRHNGLERLVKTVLRHAFFDRPYYATLAQCFRRDFGMPLRWDGLDVRLMNACQLAFPDNHFDFVFSRAVFEHIDGVDRASAEISRVLRPGGIAFIEVHLFASLSGGHNQEWTNPSVGRPRRVAPWDHLRKNHYPAPCYLNRMLARDYLDVFRRSFVLRDVRYAYEGEQYLTGEIQRELTRYSREELLAKTLSVVLEKPA